MSDPLYERLQRLKHMRRSAGEETNTRPPAVDIADRAGSVKHSSGDESDASLSRLGFRRMEDGIRERRVIRDIGVQAGRIRQLCDPPGGYLVPGDRKELLFFDAETTGLSAGAGTVAFLVGAARIVSDDTVEVIQLLLPDYPFEPEFLAHTSGLLTADSRLVSYNGKSFDTHVLRSRFLQSGYVWDEPPQIDLLYPTRRLWSALLPDCRLATVETRVLGVERELDLPGSEVPERYFAFLETGAGEVMREVVAHHEQDIVSLVRLLGTIEEVLHAVPENTKGSLLPPDTVGTARMLLPYDVERSIEMLRRNVDLSNPLDGERAKIVMLAGLLKRQRRYTEAAEIWSTLFRHGRSEFAGVELAKHLEHRERKFEAALSVCDGIIRLRGTSTPSLDHRRARVLRKLAGARSS